MSPPTRRRPPRERPPMTDPDKDSIRAECNPLAGYGAGR
jgi:hypothetical protein